LVLQYDWQISLVIQYKYLYLLA